MGHSGAIPPGVGSERYVLARDNGNPPGAADMDFVGLGERGGTSLHYRLWTIGRHHIGLKGGHFRPIRDMAGMACGDSSPSEPN